MIRVLHYGMSPNRGGIETYLLNLAQAIDPELFRFDFLYSDAGERPVFATELPQSRFFGVTPRRSNPIRNRSDLDELFSQDSFDVLHFHANTASYVAPVMAALRHNVPVVYHSHNAGASRSRLTRVLHAFHRSTLPWGRIARVAVSQDAGRWMFGDLHSFEVIYNGIDVDAFQFRQEARSAARAAWGIAPEMFVVGQVGAFLPAKNHEFTLKVFAELLRLQPDARLVLVGDGPEERSIRQRVSVLGLAEHVRFLGRRSDIADILAGMDALVMPSVHEGFGLVALEAQASGLPCLLSESIPPEVAVTPQCRRLALSRAPSYWANALLAARVLPDRGAGRDAVANASVSLKSSAEAIMDLYEKTCPRI